MAGRIRVEQKWRRLLRWIKQEFPPPRPITVHQENGSCLSGDDLGYAHLTKGNKFVVAVNRHLPYWAKAEVLVHEWAHVLTWLGNDSDMHGEEWGLNYARIYQAFCDYNESNDGG